MLTINDTIPKITTDAFHQGKIKKLAHPTFLSSRLYFCLSYRTKGSRRALQRV